MREALAIDATLEPSEQIETLGQLSMIAEVIPNGMLVVDGRARIILVNGELCKIFGYAKSELLGQPIEIFLPEHVREKHVGHRTQFLANPSVLTMGKTGCLQGRRKDGSSVSVEIGLKPIETHQGTIVLAVVADVSETVHDQERLREAIQAAELANQAKSEFLSAMSHELRTPLNAIIGFSQGLLERIDRHPLNEHQQDRIGKIYQSGQHLLSLINDILDIAKVESGRMEVNSTTFTIKSAVDEIQGMVVGLVREKPGIELRVDVSSDLPPITTDREKVKQILINLIGNAVKFTEEGSITLAIRVEGDQFAFSVTDTGVGIPASELDRVFDKFHQIQQQGAKTAIKGSGLGLTICEQFAELLEGSLNVTSEVGKGSTFTLSLPRIYLGKSD